MTPFENVLIVTALAGSGYLLAYLNFRREKKMWQRAIDLHIAENNKLKKEAMKGFDMKEFAREMAAYNEGLEKQAMARRNAAVGLDRIVSVESIMKKVQMCAEASEITSRIRSPREENINQALADVAKLKVDMGDVRITLEQIQQALPKPAGAALDLVLGSAASLDNPWPVDDPDPLTSAPVETPAVEPTAPAQAGLLAGGHADLMAEEIETIYSESRPAVEAKLKSLHFSIHAAPLEDVEIKTLAHLFLASGKPSRVRIVTGWNSPWPRVSNTRFAARLEQVKKAILDLVHVILFNKLEILAATDGVWRDDEVEAASLHYEDALRSALALVGQRRTRPPMSREVKAAYDAILAHHKEWKTWRANRLPKPAPGPLKSIFHVPGEEVVRLLVRVDDNSDNPYKPANFEITGLAHQFFALHPEQREKVLRAWKENNEESLAPRITPWLYSLKEAIAKLIWALMCDLHPQFAAQRGEIVVDELEPAALVFQEGLRRFNKYLEAPGKMIDSDDGTPKSTSNAFRIILMYHEVWLERIAGAEPLVPSPTAA